MASLGSSEGVDNHAVSHGTEGLFRKDFSTHVAYLAFGRNVKKLALSESNKFFESMISDVDVFHTAMQNFPCFARGKLPLSLKRVMKCVVLLQTTI